MTENPTRRPAPAALVSGVLMAIYLVLRPYGDVGDGPGMAEAFASPLWVLAHLAGAAGLAAAAWWAVRMSALASGRVARLAAWAGPLGLVGVLPYYGAETFALHAIGRRAMAGQDVLPLVAEIRNHPAALTLFGLGLLLLAVAGISAAVGWQRAGRGPAAWPLGLMMAGVLPQFYLPAPGRMAYGLLFLAAALVMAWADRGARATTATPAPASGSAPAGSRR